MKTIWGAAALAMCSVAAPVMAQAEPPPASAGPLSPEKVALGEEIVRLAYPEGAREAMFGGMVDTIIAQINQANQTQLAAAPAEVRSFVMERQQHMIGDLKQIMARHIPTIMDGLALAYADSFTAEELAEIRDFVATPAGSAFLQKSADLVSNPHYTAVTQPYMNEVMSEAQAWQQQLVADLQERFGQPDTAQ